MLRQYVVERPNSVLLEYVRNFAVGLFPDRLLDLTEQKRGVWGPFLEAESLPTPQRI